VLKKLFIPIGLLFFIVVSESVIDGTSIIMNLKSVLLVTGGTLLSAFIAFPLKTFSCKRGSNW
jgi:flagellar motor component MotA